MIPSVSLFVSIVDGDFFDVMFSRWEWSADRCYLITKAVMMKTRYSTPPVNANRFATPFREGEMPRSRKLTAIKTQVNA